MARRQASPRLRRRRRVERVVAIVVVLVVGWAIVQAVQRHRTAAPTPPVDYGAQMHDLVEQHLPDGPDGWPAVDAALKTTSDVLAACAERERQHPEEDPAPVLVEALRDEGVFDELERVADARRLMPPAVWPISSVTFRSTVRRELGDALVLRMQFAHERGDDAERVAAFRQLLALARTRSGYASLLGRLKALLPVRSAFKELGRQLDSSGLPSPETRAALLEAMDEQLDWPPFSFVLEGERLVMYDVMQTMYVDDGHGDGRLDTGLGGLFMARRNETMDVYSEFVDGLIANLERPPDQPVFDVAAFCTQLGRRHGYIQDLLPALDRATTMARTAEADVEAMRQRLTDD